MTQAPETFSIGEAVKRLSGEMDISESNLRFWEKEGLLQPQRTPGGHRLFTEADLDRIRLIKELQAKRYIPLDAIKHSLATGLSNAEIRHHFEAGDEFFRPFHYDPNFDLMSREQLLEKTHLAPEQLDRFETAGLLLPTLSGEHPVYDEDDVRVAEAYQELVGYGLEVQDLEKYGHMMAEMIEYQMRVYIERLGMTTPVEQFKTVGDRVKELNQELQRYLMRKLTLQISKQLMDQGVFDPIKQRLEAEKGCPSA